MSLAAFPESWTDFVTFQGLIVDQTIEKVSFCAPDRNHEKGFAYICRDGTTRRWMCPRLPGAQGIGRYTVSVCLCVCVCVFGDGVVLTSWYFAASHAQQQQNCSALGGDSWQC